MTVQILQELISFLEKITPSHYTQQCQSLSGASIGQHVRHTIEMYQCLYQGYENGSVNYTQRKRDVQIESSEVYAIECLQTIVSQLYLQDKTLFLVNENEELFSSYKREILYCDEHAIHHLALIKVGINEIGGYTISDSFGVAPSTIKYRQSCVQ